MTTTLGDNTGAGPGAGPESTVDYAAVRPLDVARLVRDAARDPDAGIARIRDAQSRLGTWLRTHAEFLHAARGDLDTLESALRDARLAERRREADAEEDDAQWVSRMLKGLPSEDAFKAHAALKRVLEVEQDMPRAPEAKGWPEPPDPLPHVRARLRPYQMDGVRFLLSRGLNAILADEMGLGKTVTVIAAVSAAEEHALVVAPANVLYNWADEVAHFTDEAAAIYHHGEITGDPGARFLLTTYDALASLDANAPWMRGRSVLILDEAHYVRNPRTRRARLVKALPQKRRLLLTGTPLVNGIEDYHALLSQVDPKRWGKRAAFKENWLPEPGLYNAYPQVREATAALLHRAAGDVMLRRRKDDVLKELPPRIVRVRRHALSPARFRRYEALERRARDAVAKDESAEGAALEALHAMRQHLAMARVDATVERVRELLAQNEPVVVFSHYLDPLHRVADALGDDVAVVLEGATDPEDRQEIARAFGAPDGPRVVLAQLEAGGVGLNLTAARHVLFIHFGWTPAVHAQAMDRVHRIGQDRPVIVEFFVTPDTIDERVAEILLRKEDDQNIVLADDADVHNRDALADALKEDLARDAPPVTG